MGASVPVVYSIVKDESSVASAAAVVVVVAVMVEAWCSNSEQLDSAATHNYCTWFAVEPVTVGDSNGWAWVSMPDGAERAWAPVENTSSSTDCLLLQVTCKNY